MKLVQNKDFVVVFGGKDVEIFNKSQDYQSEVLKGGEKFKGDVHQIQFGKENNLFIRETPYIHHYELGDQPAKLKRKID